MLGINFSVILFSNRKMNSTSVVIIASCQALIKEQPIVLYCIDMILRHPTHRLATIDTSQTTDGRNSVA